MVNGLNALILQIYLTPQSNLGFTVTHCGRGSNHQSSNQETTTWATAAQLLDDAFTCWLCAQTFNRSLKKNHLISRYPSNDVCICSFFCPPFLDIWEDFVMQHHSALDSHQCSFPAATTHIMSFQFTSSALQENQNLMPTAVIVDMVWLIINLKKFHISAC